MDADAQRDVTKRDSVEPVFREQVLRGVEDLFQAFGALLRLTAPLALRSFRHLPSPFADSEARDAEIA